MTEIWFAWAASLALFGSIWQMLSSMFDRLHGMRFLKDYNSLLKEETTRRRGELPWWARLRRRRMTKLVQAETYAALDPSEQAQARGYDRASIGWSFVLVGAFIACWKAWAIALTG